MNQDQSLEFAKKYIEDMLSFFGVNVEVEAEVVDETIHIRVPSSDDSSLLIGRGADTLRSFQHMVGSALRNQSADISRVNLDIAGYKAARAEKIAEQARQWIAEVRETGDSHVARINAADRRIVHHVASEYDDIRTFSEGEGRDRVIVIAQKSS